MGLSLSKNIPSSMLIHSKIQLLFRVLGHVISLTLRSVWKAYFGKVKKPPTKRADLKDFALVFPYEKASQNLFGLVFSVQSQLLFV